MIREKKPDRWFFPYDFISDGEIFIGYKAPTRFSELAIEFPEMIESKMEGKYRIGRFRFENSANFLQSLPFDVRNFVAEELREHEVRHEVYKQKAVYVPETKKMRIETVKETLF